MSVLGAVTPGGWMGSVGLSSVPAGFVRRPVGRGRDRVVPRAAVAGLIPVISARGCARWNGTPCYLGVVTNLLVNAATSGGGRSSKDPVCVGPAWGNTGGG